MLVTGGSLLPDIHSYSTHGQCYCLHPIWTAAAHCRCDVTRHCSVSAIPIGWQAVPLSYCPGFPPNKAEVKAGTVRFQGRQVSTTGDLRTALVCGVCPKDHCTASKIYHIEKL